MIIEINQTISHYKILKKLGAGGMGEVYLAEDTELRRKVALKFLPPQFTSDPELKARFKREARAAAALNHPNIITVHEISDYQGISFIVMEYVEGASLGEVIAREKLPIEKALEIVIQICEGLRKAHRADIVHRDIKPANILIDHDGRVKIVDFGIAKLLGDTPLTIEGSVIGTPYYMSPEQAKGEKLDQRSDIFSVGVVLYELITGQLPFQGDPRAVLYAIINKTSPPLARSTRGISERLQQIIDKALTKEPQRRYQQIDGLQTDLKKQLKILSKTSTAIPSPRQGKTPRRKNLWLTLVSAAAVLFVVFAIYLRPRVDPSSDTVPLSISTIPIGAAVFLNGDSIGLSPITNYLVKADTISLSVRKRYYFPKDSILVIAPGRVASFRFNLQPVAFVSIQVNPSDAEVVLDGQKMTSPRLAGLALSVGAHIVNISRPNYQSLQDTFSVLQGDTTLFYSLKPEDAPPPPTIGRIQIASMPAGAAIFLNGKSQGSTPKTIRNWEAGDYKIVLRKAGYKDSSLTVTVTTEKITKVDVRLALPTGKLRVRIIPSGSIYVDGKLQKENTADLYETILAVGLYQLQVENPALNSVLQKEVNIEMDQLQEFTIDFNKVVTLTITSAPILGEIFIDGNSKGYAPKQLTLRVGQHTIEVRRDGFVGETRVINLENDPKEPLKLNLRKIQ